ncbi:MAG: DUF4124 domain-containing protein [Deltaproteobacteria bacterium]|nr:DUF4124 domain-containing protein [Deltaproteobacteria bacterium]
MKKVIQWMVILSLVFFPLLSLNAQLYIWTDENGVKHFSDTQPTEVSKDDIEELVEDEYFIHKEIKYTYSECNTGGACIGSTFKCESDIQKLVAIENISGLKAMIKKDPSVVNLSECEVSPLLASAAWGHEEISQILIENGANVNFRHAEYGITPLHQAVLKRSINTIKLLLKYGANVNAQTSDSSGSVCIKAVRRTTPLHWALVYMGEPTSSCYPECAEIVKILIENGADPLIKNLYGYSPLDIARIRGDLHMFENIYKALGMPMPGQIKNTPETGVKDQ